MNATARAAVLGGRGPQRLERGAGVIDVARAARGGEAEAAVGVLLAGQPGQRSRRGPETGGAQGQHGERGQVDLVRDGPVAADGLLQRGDQVAPGEAADGRPAARTTRIVRSSAPISENEPPPSLM